MRTTRARAQKMVNELKFICPSPLPDSLRPRGRERDPLPLGQHQHHATITVEPDARHFDPEADLIASLNEPLATLTRRARFDLNVWTVEASGPLGQTSDVVGAHRPGSRGDPWWPSMVAR